MTKAKDAVITVKSVYRQAFIELILQRQQKLRNEPRNENDILNRKENVDGDRNQTYNYITPDAVYTA